MNPATRFAWNEDLPGFVPSFALACTLIIILALVWEWRRRALPVLGLLLGTLAAISLALTVLRPVRVSETFLPSNVTVAVFEDHSLSMRLPEKDSTRSEQARVALRSLEERFPQVRFEQFRFGARFEKTAGGSDPNDRGSDLKQALRTYSERGERASSVLVMSDGVLDAPRDTATNDELRRLLEPLHVPIHTFAVAEEQRKDVSIREVAWAGSAIAHVPVSLHVVAECSGGSSCERIQVAVREYRDNAGSGANVEPVLLAKGTLAQSDPRTAAADLTITLDRAGTRILEVTIDPGDDTFPANNRRLLSVNVSRERVRILHVAGRATNDVRSLRTWLKRNTSIDLITFFILRTPTDDVRARNEDLALIPFPVDDLFNEHLPSFDAVILQDFDAQTYGLEKHLPSLAQYVRAGGGLIMVGGPNAFVAGGYAHSPLAKVLPVSLDQRAGSTANEITELVPSWTEDGKTAPITRALYQSVGDELPTMTGSNVVGDLREGAFALWVHPMRKTLRGQPMPILSLAEHGDGRTIALTVDGTWLLEFSTVGAKTMGRAYRSLWDGLVGWLMRDPQFEPVAIEFRHPCSSFEPVVAELSTLAGKNRRASIQLRRIGASEVLWSVPDIALDEFGKTSLTLPKLSFGAYTLRAQIDKGVPFRRDFACEDGGIEWATTTPAPERLKRLAEVGGGTFSDLSHMNFAAPKMLRALASKSSNEFFPAWGWASIAAIVTGLFWIVRRAAGLR